MNYLIVPNWVIRLHAEHNISAGSVVCFIFLLNRCNDDECQLYMDEIAEGCGISKRQAARYIKDLISAGLIERERPKVFGAPLIYRIAYLQNRQVKNSNN